MVRTKNAEVDPFKFDASFLFCIIGEKTRLSIISELLSEPKTVDQIRAKIKIEPSLLSKHLAALNTCGLVRRKRQGRSYVCEINPKVVRKGKPHSLFLHCCEINLKDC